MASTASESLSAQVQGWIRACKPNEIWHVDTSLLRLLDGSRVYMHAIIDNYSRRILAWTVRATFDTGVTAALIREAAKGLSDAKPSTVKDNFDRGLDLPAFNTEVQVVVDFLCEGLSDLVFAQ